jgi:hypothetical protein
VHLLCRMFCLRTLNPVGLMRRETKVHSHKNIDTGTAVNRNEVLLVLSIHATSFGSVGRPYGLRYMALNRTMYVFFVLFSNL